MAAALRGLDAALRGRGRGLVAGSIAIGRVKRAVVFCAALGLAFWLGTAYSPSVNNLPPPDNNLQTSRDLQTSPQPSGLPPQKQPDIESLDNQVRELAKQQLAHSQENEELRVQLALRDAEIARLTAENQDLVGDILHRDETILTYRQIIDATGGDLVIHALAEEPAFAPGRRRLSAVLVRAKGNKFKGAYYFDIVSAPGGKQNGEQQQLRAPPKPAKLDFQRYREIAETIDLPDDARIVKMRLVVTDAKGKVAAIDELVFDNGESGEGGEGGNGNNGSRRNRQPPHSIE